MSFQVRFANFKILFFLASPPWLRGSTPISTTPGLNQKSVVCPSNEPLKSPNFITVSAI